MSITDKIAAAHVPAGTILVVDDNEMNRDLLSRRLRRDGHTVLVAERIRRGYGLSNPIARITSAPSLIATSTGSGAERQPSSMSLPSTSHGSQMYGIAMLARTASTIVPEESVACCPVTSSVATM